MGRVEDPRLLTGRGCYVDDIHLPAMLHMAVLRSPLASAAIRRIDGRAAGALAGIHAVWTGTAWGLVPLPPFRIHPGLAPDLTAPLLAVDRVRHVGEPVAVVLAESPYAAEDALDVMQAEYDPLPVCPSVAAAMAAQAPPVHDHVPGNIGGQWRYRTGDAEAALRAAPVRLSLSLSLSRGHASPLETRGCVARFDRSTGELTLWVGHQAPYSLREALAALCAIPRHRVRVVTPDVGGAFGLKVAYCQEYFLAARLAVHTGRPVKWIEDRREHLLAATADRETLHEIEIGATSSGELLAVKDRLWTDLGAYATVALTGMQFAAMHVVGPYRVRHIDVDAHAVLTHRAPTGPFRGFGRPNGTFAIERALDCLAQTLDLDPAEVRRRNLIRREEMPWSVGITPPGMPPMVYDSGDFPALLSQVLTRLDYRALRREQAAQRRHGRLLGIGLACYVEANVAGTEGVTVRLEPSGRALLLCGVPNLGQGAGSTWAGLAARELGLRPELVDVISGDTATLPTSVGTFGSRTALVVANGAVLAARSLAARIKSAAARLLECDSADLELADGSARVRGAPERSVTLRELCTRAVAPPPGLEATEYYAPQGQTWSAGAHAAVVEVDTSTAQVVVRRYVVAEDCGTLLEPQLVEGQVVGGVAQGIGGSLYEQLVYDERGQLLTATLMDYLMPTACEVPEIEVLHGSVPSPLNPLGVKGAGEGGCMGAYAALAAALEDALRPLGVQVTALPLPPDQLYRLVHPARGPGV